jgi:hypothetical protein
LIPVVAFVVSMSTLAHAGIAPTSQGNALARPYHSVTIGEPAPNATIFDNTGNVAVVITTSPALRTGDRIALDIDGRPMPPRSQERFKLSGLERGEHTLKAGVIDANGDSLISSALVTFYMWRGSLLFPNRRKS